VDHRVTQVERALSDSREGELTAEILIIGAGVSGIGMAIKLRENGFNDFTMVDKGADVGGTWRDNIYPGLTCDVPVLTFCYSFEPKSDWSSIWAPQAEILEYLRHCADKYDLRQHCRFNEEVLDATYDEQRCVWVTRFVSGLTCTSRFLINGSGYFSTPRLPDIEGIESFAGQLVHTSRWPSDISLEGKRVAIIGTGATGIQLAPSIEHRVDHLDVYQRTPPWLFPKPPLLLSQRTKWVLRHVPFAARVGRLLAYFITEMVFYRVYTNYPQMALLVRAIERFCANHIRRQVDDPELVEKLTPKYRWGCKRISYSSTFYPMFNKSHVELVTDPIARIAPTGVTTADGRQRDVDVLICATGFQPFQKGALPTYPVYGSGSVELREYWDQNRYQAFRSVAVNGYPNYFMVFGPYAINGASYFGMVEIAVHTIIRALRGARAAGADAIEVTAKAQQDEFASILRRKKTSLFTVDGCRNSNTYYIDRHGDTPGFRPTYHPVTWWESRTLRMTDFHLSSAATSNVGVRSAASALRRNRGHTRPQGRG
jgi:cation diffusion facilitator CzcD-associated flavoprotein CzcO